MFWLLTTTAVAPFYIELLSGFYSPWTTTDCVIAAECSDLDHSVTIGPQ